MTLTELLPVLDELNRAEKLRVMHYLVTKLEKEEENLLLPGIYPVWTPFDSYEAAALLAALATDEANHGQYN